jgi:hypothetical protein
MQPTAAPAMPAPQPVAGVQQAQYRDPAAINAQPGAQRLPPTAGIPQQQPAGPTPQQQTYYR